MGTLGQCGKHSAGGYIRVKKGTVHVQDCGPHPVHGSTAQLAGVMYFRNLMNFFWDSHASLVPWAPTTTSARPWLPWASPALPLHQTLLSRKSPPGIPLSLPASGSLLPSLGNLPPGGGRPFTHPQTWLLEQLRKSSVLTWRITLEAS